MDAPPNKGMRQIKLQAVLGFDRDTERVSLGGRGQKKKCPKSLVSFVFCHFGQAVH
jgi:hypothetical protein